MNIIEELYYGNINPSSRRIKKDSDYMHLVGILTNLDDAFKESLSEKQLEQYEKIKETLSEQRDILEFEMFTYGLKLGGQFAFAVKDDCNSQFVF